MSFLHKKRENPLLFQMGLNLLFTLIVSVLFMLHFIEILTEKMCTKSNTNSKLCSNDLKITFMSEFFSFIKRLFLKNLSLFRIRFPNKKYHFFTLFLFINELLFIIIFVFHLTFNDLNAINFFILFSDRLNSCKKFFH